MTAEAIVGKENLVSASCSNALDMAAEVAQESETSAQKVICLKEVYDQAISVLYIKKYITVS